jgi:uncharacterized membrane protein YdjX (TVP38/TMEM64 family)
MINTNEKNETLITKIENNQNDDDLHNNNNNNSNSEKKVIQYLLAIILIVVIILIIIDAIIKPCSNHQSSCVSIGINNFIDWVKNNVILGAFLLTILYAICVVFCVPGSLLTIGAGSSFGQALGIGYGVLVGSISVFVGASLGAISSFLLGKYLLFDYVNKLIKRFSITNAIDKSIESQELKVMILLRLSPLIPFSALNYVMSGTSMRLESYALALFAMLPATIAYVYIGASVSGNYCI